MHSLCQLATYNTRIRKVFVEIGADPFLHLVHNILMRENDAKNDRLMLLSACRRAMVCTEENIIHGLGKGLLYLLDPTRSADSVGYTEAVLRWLKLNSLAFEE